MQSKVSSKFQLPSAKQLLVALASSVLIEALFVILSFWRDPTYAISLKVSGLRFICILGVFGLYWLFRARSDAWRIDLDFTSKPQLACVIVLVAVLCGALCVFGTLSKTYLFLEDGAYYEEATQHTQDGNQYNHLADALLEGHLYLDLPVADALLTMDNPYDTDQRTQFTGEDKQPIYWDYAYYEGHYYCYFGVLPCLLTFLPYKALTGMDLRTDYVVLLFACLCMMAAALLLYQFARTYYRKLPFLAYIVALLFMFGASGLLEQVYLPRLYPIPILSALMFVFLGLSFLLAAKRQFIERGSANKLLLLLGGLCIALTLGCRPQYVLAAVLIIPMFWDEIKARKFFSASGLGNTLCVIVPFLLVAAPICWYNYARFGSITDFGASYNLTGADMTSYAFDLKTTAVRVYEYLFAPVVASKTYPYIQAMNETELALPELWTNEPFFGSFFAFAPAALACFLLFGKTARAELNARGLSGFSFSCLALAAVVLLLISNVSGVTMRYFADFAWLLILPAVFIYWGRMEREAQVLDASKSSLPTHGSEASAVGLVTQSARRGWIAAFCMASVPLYLWTYLASGRLGALMYNSAGLLDIIRNILSFI